MFNNPGRKIQVIAKIMFWLIIALTAVIEYGLLISLPAEKKAVAIVVAVPIAGIILAWLSTILLYGIGTMIENIAIIREKVEIQEHNQDAEIQKMDTILQLLQTIIMKIHDLGE